VEELREELDHVRCRICYACLPCPQGARIVYLGTDVMAEHYRNMGREAFRTYPWSRVAIETDLPKRKQLIAGAESCDRCGICEERCPYGLPIMDMVDAALPVYRDILRIYEELTVSDLAA
jgi:predicted aldo/keto reductase-like oxidoreductase